MISASGQSRGEHETGIAEHVDVVDGLDSALNVAWALISVERNCNNELRLATMDCDGENSERRRFFSTVATAVFVLQTYSGAQSRGEEIMEWWLESSSAAV